MQVVLVGDVMLGRMVNEALRGASPQLPWGDTLPLFQAADVRVCNLECVLSDRGQPWGTQPGQTLKAFHFRAQSDRVEVLRAAGIQAVSLANNHVLDFQAVALAEMIARLDDAGIAHAGAGLSLAEARRPALWVWGATRIGMLAFTDNEPEWEAGADRPGIWYVPIEEYGEQRTSLLESVRQLRPDVDLVIVSAHWGGNVGYRPPAEHRELAHQLIDAGADVIFGHSSHVFRGVEIWKEKPILYGTGNFVDDYAVDLVERNDESMLFRLDYGEGFRLEEINLFPTHIAHFQAHRASGRLAERIAWRMQELCEELGTRMEWNPQWGCLQGWIEGPAGY